MKRERLPGVDYDEGLEFKKTGRLEEAIEMFEHVAKIRPIGFAHMPRLVSAIGRWETRTERFMRFALR